MSERSIERSTEPNVVEEILCVPFVCLSPLVSTKQAKDIGRLSKL